MRTPRSHGLTFACCFLIACASDPLGDPGAPEEPGSTTQPLSSDCPAVRAGDGASCQDVLGLKRAAADTCAATGLELAMVVPDAAGCDDGQATSLEVRCCPIEARASCWSYLVGDATSCVADATRWTEALAACAAAELVLGDFDVTAGACADGSSIQAAFFCCVAAG